MIYYIIRGIVTYCKFVLAVYLILHNTSISGCGLYNSIRFCLNFLQGIPILCRLYGLGFDPTAEEPAVVIPTDMGFVSLIGMFHGVKKPDDVAQLVDPLVVELRQLHPLMPKMVREAGSNKCWKRQVGVRVRAMICDAVERPWLKGNCFELMQHDVLLLETFIRRIRPLLQKSYILTSARFCFIVYNRNRQSQLLSRLRKVPVRGYSAGKKHSLSVHKWKEEACR